MIQSIISRFLVFALTLVVLAIGLNLTAEETQPKRVQFLSGRECAARMTMPPGFEVKCFAGEPDVVNPIGIDFDHRGRVFVLECLTYPQKAPLGKGRDRIRIFEDTNGDHVADKITTFAEGLNLATGIAVGFGGVFVGEAPEFVFLQDTNGDDKADKRTVLLDGWGLQDTHETLNSFIWGPDGWLYGCHGVFTHSRVGKPGTPDKDRIPINAGIWRYLPSPLRGGVGGGVSVEGAKFEVFAEGTSNPWGYDYDENGSGFLTACVIPHLFHIIPGGLYIRQAGQNFNPYAYGQIKEICDHVHYVGGSSHVGNKDPRRFEAGGGHAHSACLIYQGGAYPPEWNGRVFMNNLHGARINTDILKKNGSTYIGSHGPDFLVANDPNFRAIQLRTGPDGSIYMIDWYDPQICHNTDPRIWDRDHGRVYKVVYNGETEKRGNGESEKKEEKASGAASAPRVPDLSKLSSPELVELLKHKNSWCWRKALLVLQERGDKSVAPALKEMVRKSGDYRHSLRALWALNNIGAFDEEFGIEILGHSQAWVRAWAVRLLGQLDRKLVGTEELFPPLWHLEQQAGKETSPDVRVQIAATSQRLHRQGHDCRDLLVRLTLRDEDAADSVIPLMIWLAFEPYVAKHGKLHGATMGSWPQDHPIFRDQIAPRAFRRLASREDPQVLHWALLYLRDFETAQACQPSLDGLLEALRGRRLPAPDSWKQVREHLLTTFKGDAGIRRRVYLLGIHFGDKEAVQYFVREVLNEKLPAEQRIQAVQSLALACDPQSIKPLTLLTIGTIGDAPIELRRESLRALASFEGEEIPQNLLAQWAKLSPDLRREVVGLLAGRKSWAHALMDAIPKEIVEKKDLTENHVRQILAHRDAELTKKVETIWGKLREQTPENIAGQLAHFRRQLAELPADRKAGQAVFEKNCMVCHKLHGKGSEVGPDITGANRRDAEYLLTNIIDPNRVVGRDYYTAVVEDKGGQILTGLLAEDTPQRITLKGENAKLTVLPRSEIREMKIVEKSLMPEGLPNNMTEQQLRDLIAFLMEDPYLHRGLIAGPFKMALDAEGPIEKSADPLKTDGVKWKPFELGPAAVIDMEKLKALAPPTDSTAYIYMELRSPRELKTSLEVSADDDVKVWLNGKEVHRRIRAHEPARVPVELKEGTNRLLFKVHNIYGPSNLTARVSDPERVVELVRVKAP